MKVRKLTPLVALAVLAACSDTATDAVGVAPARDASLARGRDVTVVNDASVNVQAMIEAANARFAAQGRDLQIDEAWFFRVGYGVDAYRSLRSSSAARWVSPSVTYMIDEADRTADLSAAGQEAALVRAYDRFNAVRNIGLTTRRIAYNGQNVDVADGTFNADGECVSIYDVSSPYLTADELAADIIIGGFLPADYFVKCLGSSGIIAVTWTFSSSDQNGDGYRDRVYVEQFYNDAYKWVVTGAQFGSYAVGVDLETIATHENGHAHGLGHFGGPSTESQYDKLWTHGYSPEAVMNPFYLGGEKRDLLPTDLAALRTMYARNH